MLFNGKHTFFCFFVNFPCYSMGSLHFVIFPCYSMGSLYFVIFLCYSTGSLRFVIFPCYLMGSLHFVNFPFHLMGIRGLRSLGGGTDGCNGYPCALQDIVLWGHCPKTRLDTGTNVTEAIVLKNCYFSQFHKTFS